MKGKEAGKAVQRTLPSPRAIRKLEAHIIGRILLRALEKAPVLPSRVLTSNTARPSRFAILLLFYEVMAERCSRLGLKWSSMAYEAA